MKRSFLLAAAAVLAGCLPSVHPLYTEADLVFDEALLGSWTDGKGKHTYAFSRAGAKAYHLAVAEEGEASAGFEARLLKLGDALFLDLFPKEPGVDNGLLQAHLVPAHTFSRVWVDSDTLRLAMLDPLWIRETLDQEPGALAHEVQDDLLLLTADTASLQRFVVAHSSDPAAFPGPADFFRRKP